MDGVVGGLGDTTAVTANQSHLASPTQPTQRLAPAFSPSMATKAESPVVASSAAATTSSPNVKTNATPIGNVTGTPGGSVSSSTIGQSSPAPVSHRPSPSAGDSSKVLDKRRLQELVKEVDPLEQLDDDVEEMLMQIADDFIDNVVSAACQFAKHRKSNTVEVKDVQLHLERNWNMWIPGFGSEELKPYKKSAMTEAHKQRLALIKKTLKKY